MIKREKKRKLRGSVLLTVVCVMSLLIVFLFGTLALATAANNRAHVNYSTAQTGVTSRTVVDAAIKAMEANTTFGNAVSALKFDNSGSANGFAVNVELGSELEAGRYGHIKPVSISAVGKKQFYDSNKNEWIDGDIIRFTSTVSMAGVDSTTSAYIVKQPPGEGYNDSPGGAGFVTTSSASINCQTNLFGGSYINLPKLETAENFDYTYRTENEYNKWKVDKTIYRQFQKNDAFQLTNANSDFTVEADLYVNNNLDFHQAPNILFPKKGTGITVWGDMIFSEATSSDRMQIIMPFDTSNLEFNEVPYIYVDGCLKVTNKSIINTHEKHKYPLNIFCGYAEITAGDGPVEVGGDIYCMNSTKESRFECSTTTTLYDWTGSVVNKSTASGSSGISGSIYSKGDVCLKNITVGDVRVEGNCRVGSNVVINGDLVVGGKLTIDSGATITGNIYYNPAINNFDAAIGVPSDDIVEVDFIYHPEEKITNENLELHENDKIYYYMYESTEQDTETWSGYLDIDGNTTGSWDNKFYYKWREDVDPADIEAVRNSGDIDAIKEYLDLGYGWMTDGQRPEASVDDNNKDYYYVETDVVANEDGEYSFVKTSRMTGLVRFIFDKETGLKYEESDMNDMLEIIVPEYYSIPNADGSERTPVLRSTEANVSFYGYSPDEHKIALNKNTNEFVHKDDAANAIANAAKFESEKAKYKDITKDNYDDGSDNKYKNNIYPECADRDVILGLTTIKDSSGNDINPVNTKIIKRLEEILDSNSDYYVSNPYKYDTLTGDLSNTYNTVKNDSTVLFKSVNDVIKSCGWASSVVGYGATPYVHETSVVDGTNFENSQAIYIDKSCTLSGFTSRNVVINPGEKDILIIIKNFSVASGRNIIVDDRLGGTVNFYIESAPAGKVNSFNLDGGYITTVKYQTAFEENNGGSLRYNSPSKEGYNLSDLGKPKVNVYGGANSKMNVGNAEYIVANILSSNIQFSMGATNGDLSFSNIYYNDVDMKHPVSNGASNMNQYIFGSLNSKTASLPNQLNIIFITDTEGGGGGGGGGDNAFNYRILYYDEY